MEEQAIAQELDLTLSRLARLQEAVYRLRRYPIERSHYLILRMLIEAPRRSSDLADALVLDHTTIVRQISALEKSGLVTREPDPDDGRSSLLVATAKGRTLCAEMSAVRVKRIETLLESWSAEEQQQLIRALTQLNDSLMQWVRDPRRQKRPRPVARRGRSASPGEGEAEVSRSTAPRLRKA